MVSTDRELDEKVHRLVMLETGYNTTDQIPFYSSSIAAAWEVLGKFDTVDVSKRKVGWHCTIWLEHDKYRGEYGDTAPEAICRAALKAMK